jgi:hypothetical protein
VTDKFIVVAFIGDVGANDRVHVDLESAANRLVVFYQQRSFADFNSAFVLAGYFFLPAS